ncbi:MAG: ribonuclease E/G, partial [Erythrobacter sp.]|nr:ribonuclease E/G [Erythrobacter sp.]
EFMKLLMPSHARRVKHYSDPVPLFQRYGAEDQLTAMYDPMVQLKSGGYLIINPTEALVSIDINSGRSTKEHGIEQTALHTNLEAAREIARQLRLRDMAGLVVIDFIDMEHNSNVRKVERAMKDALKNDRARIQVGRISGFGLMEMSRQRLRTGVLEATTRMCPHCDGTGLVRTASSAGLSALRLIEDEAAKGKGTIITLYASTEASIYLLNAKRADLAEIEDRYGVTVEVQPEGEDEGAKMRVTSSGPRPTAAPKFEAIVDDDDDFDIDEDEAEDDEDEEAAEDEARERSDDGGRNKKRRRRRRGGRGRNRDRAEDGEEAGDAEGETDAEAEDAEAEGVDAEATDGEDGDKPRRRRGRRGGRGRNRQRQGDDEAVASDPDGEPVEEVEAASEAEAPAEEAPADEAPAEEAKPKRRTRRKKADEAEAEAVVEEADEAPAEAEPVAEKPKRTRRKKPAASEAEAAEPVAEEAAEAAPAPEAAEEEAPKPKRTRRKKVEEPEAVEAAEEPAAEEPVAAAAEEGTAEAEQPRRGWWQRTFGE